MSKRSDNKSDNTKAHNHRKGQWRGKRLIIILAVFSIVFLVVLFFMSTLADQTNPKLERDVLISEASGVLGIGKDIQVLMPRQNINSDIEDEIVAMVPASKRDWVLNDDTSKVWAESFLVLQMNGKERREMLHVSPKAVQVDQEIVQGDPNSKTELSPHGYVVSFGENPKSRFYVFRVALSDAKGQARSDFMIFTWDGKAQQYTLPQMPVE